MKYAIAAVLVIVSMVAAEPPRFRLFARQSATQGPQTFGESAPYAPRGWRPRGPAFNLPQRSAPQQTYGAPSPSYGPPTQEYGPPDQEYGPPQATTTEAAYATEDNTEEIPTEEPQAENLKINTKQKTTSKLQKPTAPYFVVLPRNENLVYSLQQSAPLLTIAPAKLVAAPVSAKLQTLPFTSVQTGLVSPYSASFVQIYQ